MTTALVPALDADSATTVQIEAWLHRVRDAVQAMTTIDELNQAEAMLMAVARRLRQLNADAADAERVRILAYKRIGDVLGPADIGRPRETLEDHKVSPKSQAAMERDWAARKIAANWPIVEPALAEMKRPTINGVMREIARRTSADLLDAVDSEGALARDRLRLEFTRHLVHFAEVVQLKPEALAETLDEDRWEHTTYTFTNTRRWMAAVEAARPRGLRLINHQEVSP